MRSILKDHALLQRRKWFFIALALLLRAFYVSLAIEGFRQPGEEGLWAITTGDTRSYLDPVENLIANGRYWDDYRMPGVGAPYYLLRQFMGPAASRDALVVLQWLLSGLSVYVLALLAWRLTGSHGAGLATYALFLLSAYSSWYDARIASDSLCTSLIIFQAWLLSEAVRQQRLAPVLWAGLCLAWMVFLRPITVLLVPFAAVLVLWFWTGTGRWKTALLALLPFLVADAAWTIRNWRVNGAFRPLTNQGFLPDDFRSDIRGHLMAFVQGYGGDYIWWNPGADIRWYGMWQSVGGYDEEGHSAKEPPPYAYAPGYDRDSLAALSQRIRAVRSGALEPADSAAAVAEINATIDRYAAAYRAHRPFQYHVMSRLRMVRNLFAQHGTEMMSPAAWSELSTFDKCFKVLQVLLFLFSYGLAPIAIIWFAWAWRGRWTLERVLVPGTLVYMSLVFPIGLRMCEFRYLVHQFPFALLLSTCLAAAILARLFAQKASTQ